ncbi:NPCBM/NEW2 domain-containing protein [Actinomadura barringtoniae]|uniref:Alpha-galactosidase n=1 Tax=Actinomadura barringtoniae TaxID=1427535 RepID=A0A939P836_9ACTN|nr:NPCBM/NEW2 domain-containing protein [Actinomadura barringtoniae]MBO2447581.1 NPCBM/NEW2 domain-containing protein [Actinomadura barringtoniae]
MPDSPDLALPDGLAATPPMGFNNWNATGCAINEQMIRDTADLFVSTGLKDAGYRYVNIDDCWAEPQRDPRTGRYVAHHERFPSGIKAIADYVHAKGLKLGIYTSAGTQTCAKTMPGSLDHEDLDAQTFADWGVDYLKYDNCNNQGRAALERYTRMRDALKKTGRPIVYSLCEWGENKPWEWGRDVGHLWRTTGDITDTWTSMVGILEQNAPLAPYAGPGHWNDPDMLEVGNGGMTGREYRSHFSLWATMSAPLLIGSDLRKATPETLEILGNRDVIAVDQDSLGVQGTVLRKDDGHWVFVKPLAGGDVALTLFNQTENAATIGATASEFGLPKRPSYVVRDLWAHRDFESAGTFNASVPAHGTVMYRIKAGGDWWRQPPLGEYGLTLSPAAQGIPGTITPAGRPFTADLSVTNRGRAPLLRARHEIAAPSGWKVQPLGRGSTPILRTGQKLTARFRVTPPADQAPGSYTLNASLAYASVTGQKVRSAATESLVVPKAVPAGTTNLGDAPWATARNGLGQVERNTSVGGAPPGDGKTLTINGKTYPTGLGTHAPAEIVFFLDGRCTSLGVDVGIDDERDPRPDPTQGTASFEIWADGIKAADSGRRTWQDDAVHLNGDLGGASFLRIVTNPTSDGFRYDRGDWAGPVLTCKAAS